MTNESITSAIRPNVFGGPSYHAPLPLDDMDCLPNDRAVWRDGRPITDCPAETKVCAICGPAAKIVLTTIGDVDWSSVHRWRFGWPPLRDR